MQQHQKFLHAAAAEEESSGPHWLVITCSVVGGIVLLVGLVYGYIKYRERQVYLEYSTNPEAGIPHKSIGFNERRKLLTWKINEGEGANPVVKQASKQGYIELKFNSPPGTINSVMATKPISKGHTSYFEVEIEDNPRNSDVVIGFCTKKEFEIHYMLGMTLTSVGFHSKTGLVVSQNKTLYDYKLSAVYGETIGVGLRTDDGRVWLSYNGKFLNPPPPSEIKKEDDDDKKKNEDDDEEDEELNKQMKELELVLKEKKVAIGVREDLYPCICVDGPVKINMNVGAMQFRMHQKEISHGLLI